MRKLKAKKQKKEVYDGLKLLVMFYDNNEALKKVSEVTGVLIKDLNNWLAKDNTILSPENRKKLLAFTETNPQTEKNRNLVAKLRAFKNKEAKKVVAENKTFLEQYVNPVGERLMDQKEKVKFKICRVCGNTLAPNIRGRFCSDKCKATYLHTTPPKGKVIDILAHYNKKIKEGLKSKFGVHSGQR